MAGYGDALIATGLARGAALRGKRIAFGDGKKILWSVADQELFAHNPNIAPPGSEGSSDLEWIKYYQGNRFYASHRNGHWKFNNFRCPPGSVYFSKDELDFADKKINGMSSFVLIEPAVKAAGACVGPNKQWPVDRYQAIADRLHIQSVQLVPVTTTRKALLDRVTAIRTPTFRHALAILAKASLYIGPEGGMHHGAAAVGTPAVVIFGGFNTPRSTGYDWHQNITHGEPCGRTAYCPHCKEAMAAISVDQVFEAAMKELSKEDKHEKVS